VEGVEIEIGPDAELALPDLNEGPFWANRVWWRRAGSASIGVWGSAALMMISGVVVARALGPSGYGSVVLAIAVVSLITTFLDLTLEPGIIHHGFRALAAGDVRGLRTMLRIALLVDFGMGLLVGGLIFALAGPLTDAFANGELDPSLVRIAVVVIIAATIDGTTGAVLLLANRPDLRGWTMFAAGLARLVAVVIAVQLGGGTHEVLVAYATSAFAGSAFQAYVAWRVGWSRWRSADSEPRVREWLRKLISFGIYSSLTTTIQGAERSVVPLVLGSLSGAAAVGIFNVALLPVTLAALATQPLRIALFPEQARQAAVHDHQGLRKTIRGVTTIGLAVALPAAVAGWFLLPVLFPAIYSDQFESATSAGRILLGTAVIQVVFAWAKSFFPAIGRPGIQTVYATAFAVLVIAGMALLGGSGSTGAATAYTVAFVVTNVPLFFVANRLLDEMKQGEKAQAIMREDS
jgi:O-antigen/teichoic acid export membrane protein